MAEIRHRGSAGDVVVHKPSQIGDDNAEPPTRLQRAERFCEKRRAAVYGRCSIMCSRKIPSHTSDAQRQGRAASIIQSGSLLRRKKSCARGRSALCHSPTPFDRPAPRFRKLTPGQSLGRLRKRPSKIAVSKRSARARIVLTRWPSKMLMRRARSAVSMIGPEFLSD
jgi:hypothetical protein